MNMRSKAIFIFLVISSGLYAAQHVITRPDGSSVTISLMKGNIVEQQVDVIVNAANKELEGGTGVNGAIRQVAGPGVAFECERFPASPDGVRCPVGHVRVTGSGALVRNGVKYIIHAVGPDCRIASQAQNKEQLLRNAYWNSLEKACEYGVKTIAFPSISTGVYAYDVKEASQIAIQTVSDFVNNYCGTMSLQEIRFVLFPENFNIYFDVLTDSPVRQSQSWWSWLLNHKASLAAVSCAFLACYWMLSDD